MDEKQGTFQKTAGEEAQKIGQTLEQARKEKGLTLEEVEHATKIRKRYLAGLEREDYRVLPDAVYAQGFLKTYANYLGLDGEVLTRRFKELRRPRRERQVSYGAPKESEFDRPLIDPGKLGVAQGRQGRRRTSPSGTMIITVLVALLALAAVVGALYYVGRGVQVSSENPAPQAASGEKHQQAASGPKPDAAKPDAAKPDAAEGDGAKPEGAKPEGAETAAGAGAPDRLAVEVSVEGSPSWLSIVADGRLAYEQIAQPGFSQTFEARREISIRTGNAGAVGVEVNGQDVGRLGEAGEVLTRSFTLKSGAPSS